MKRKIIEIDEEKCNGCGLCIPDCPEGALQIIDGKARLVSDLFCDGLGACIGTCPEGAISVVEREAEAYDEKKVMANVVPMGRNTIAAHLSHLYEHAESGYLSDALEYLRENNIEIPEFSKGGGCGGCPGMASIDLRVGSGASTSPGGDAIDQDKKGDVTRSGKTGSDAGDHFSELRQWPVQLKLLNPGASYFNDSDLLIAADCSPFAYADFHRKFVKGRIVIMFCPKLDPYIDEYIEKMAAIFSGHDINSITVLKMEVPCCGGVSMIVKKALDMAGKDIEVREITVSIEGKLL